MKLNKLGYVIPSLLLYIKNSHYYSILRTPINNVIWNKKTLTKTVKELEN